MAAGPVNAGWQLLGLLALAFVGSGVVRGRRVKGFGLPSGSEWLLTGVLLGPEVLRAVGPVELGIFSPLVAAATGWVALMAGQRLSRLGRSGEERRQVTGPSGVLRGILATVLTTLVVSALVYQLLGRVVTVGLREQLGTALTLGLALAASTRKLVDWARERLGSAGRVTGLLGGMVTGGELVALLGTAPVTTLLLAPEAPLSDWGWRAVSPLVLGALSGLLCLTLLRFEVRVAETWGILLGTTLLATGVALRLGASVLATGFVLGWVLGRSRQSSDELRLLTRPTEGTVVLPLMVLAGAVVEWSALGRLWYVVVVAVVGSWLNKQLVSWQFGSPLPRASWSRAAMGLSMSSSGETACLVGLGYWLVAPSALGQLVLAAAVLSSLLGELFGAWGIRHLLRNAGEAKANPHRDDALTQGVL